MPCYSPLTAYRTSSGEVVFAELGRYDITQTLELPCGQCVGCRLERSRQWAVRCMHEASLYDENCFITLTYKENPVSLDYRDFQLFMKRLRKAFKGSRIRFYMCGEYGETFDRPHFHACLFNFNFPDRLPLRLLGDSKLYKSAILESLWPHGFSSIGAVTFESAAYVSRYIMKKVTGDAADKHYEYITEDGEILQRTPEFNHMSLKPGIGAGWLDKFITDVYPSGMCVSRGMEQKPPKYYDRRYKKIDPLDFERLVFEREQLMLDRIEDNTVERLAVRKQVVEARVKLLKRSL